MRIIIGFLLFLLSLPAYAEVSGAAKTPAYAEPPKRVVSVGGDLTEIVYALQAQDLLVGNDTTSYYPEAAKKLPKVGYRRALSAEGILSLRPDLVILTEESGPPSVLQQIESAGLVILRLKAGKSIDDVKENISSIGNALHLKEKAEALIAQIKRDSESLASITENQPSRKRVMFIMQHGGGVPMAAGTETVASSIIDLSGAENVIKDYKGYKHLTPEAAVALSPDVILVTYPGQVGGQEKLQEIQGISLTPAAQKGHIIEMDPSLLLGFGLRTVKAATRLNEAYQEL